MELRWQRAPAEILYGKGSAEFLKGVRRGRTALIADRALLPFGPLGQINDWLRANGRPLTRIEFHARPQEPSTRTAEEAAGRLRDFEPDLVVAVGGGKALSGELSAAILVAFALYVQRFFEPIRALTMQYTQFQRAMTAGTRIFELLDVEPEVVDRPDAIEMPAAKGEIHYDNISFEYVKGAPVLQDINLHIMPGQTVALVGQTGAGKTTMVSLLSRFYDVTNGRITVDGHDLRDVTRPSLASQMSMVLQEPFLYSVTVAENIRFRYTDASMERVFAAAKAVGAHDFIMRLEDGYDTVLQERGGNLSIGQRQLISFARAILADPQILVLDEATANIDTITEVLIQSALRELLKGRTAVVIAHRLSTIQNSDMIVVMEHGRIIDTGTHDQLLERCALYARLYALNFDDADDLESIDSQGSPRPSIPDSIT